MLGNVIGATSSNAIVFSLPPTLHTLEFRFYKLRGGDSFNPSATMSYSLHRGSVHNKSGALIVFVGVMALGPPIHRSLIADADIGHEPSTNPLGLSWGGGGEFFKICLRYNLP